MTFYRRQQRPGEQTIPPPDNIAPPAPESLVRPLKRLLRPLVRLAILSGITFPILADVLRGLFVEVALRDVLRDPAARTDSRISLLTGVYRKEIRRLRKDEDENADSVPEIVTISSQIIGRWLGDPAYTDEQGRPRDLPRLRAASEGGPSFEALVESVTMDIRSRAVLDDFADQGLVTLVPGDAVRLNQTAFIPAQGSAELLFFFARNLHDHAAAAVENIITKTGPVFLDSSVHYDRLPAEIAARLETMAQTTAEKALLDVNRAALELSGTEGDAAPGANLKRVNFGIYIYSCDDSSPPGKTA